jgi:hypothetical protein
MTTMHFTLVSENEEVLRLVADFARGLGCSIEPVAASMGRGIRVEVPDAGGPLLELLTHVALSTAKADVDVTEPLCRVTSRHEGARSDVTLGLRIAELTIDTTAAAAGPRAKA